METTESCPRKRKRLNSSTSDNCDGVKLKRSYSSDEDSLNSDDIVDDERGLLDLSDEILLEIFKDLKPNSLRALGW